MWFKEINTYRFFSRIFIQILLLTKMSASFAAVSPIVSGAKGIWMSPGEAEESSFKWKAHWIWDSEEEKTSMLLTRRRFDLSSVPESAVVRITASSKYKLYINGSYVLQGPARCAPHHQSYDILDITDMLKQGENLIAVRVHHQDGKKSYQYDGRAGLLAQINMENEIILMSDTSWKVAADPSWDNDTPKISRFQQVVNDRVDFRNYPKEWETLDFDDSSWGNATVLMRKSGWPSPQKNAPPQPLTPPWTSLVARDIPYLVERDIVANNLIESTRIITKIDEEPILLMGKNTFASSGGKNLELPIVSDAQSWFLLYDFGEVINGMPKLEIQGAAGTEIQIVTAPFIVDDKFSKVTVDSEFVDKIILSGGRDQWEATYFKPTRYLGIIVKNDATLKLHSAGMHELKYPFESKGSIESQDAPWIKQYFDAAAKTIHVCTTDGYTDNYRERRQYAQTGYYAALGNYYVFGDLALQRRYLVQTAQEQQANGIMPAYAPAASDDYMIILDSNCLWIRSLRNYLLYSGDYVTVRELLPAATKLIELLHSFSNELGMIENPPYAYWLDHALNDRRGANLNLNGHYLGALEDFAQILMWLNKSDAKEFERRAALLRKSIQHNFWNKDKKLFVDTVIDGHQSEMYSEHANAMALALNIATPGQAKLIASQLLEEDQHNYIKRASGITMVTPAMSYFLHRGLCDYGYIEESFKLFNSRFEKMLAPGTNGTLWEEWWLDAMGRTGKLQKGRTRSDAQTESAFPPALFAEFLLGVKPLKPGMREVVLSYQKSGLGHVKGTIPSPSGILTIEWNLNKQRNSLTVEVPDKMIVKIDLNSLGIKKEQKIEVNGKMFQSSLANDQYLQLKSGKQTLEF